MIKVSDILRRAAEMVEAYNEKYEGFNSQWEYGCHAISRAAIELGAYEGYGHDQEGYVMDSGEIEIELPEVFAYFSLMKPRPDYPYSVWFNQAMPAGGYQRDQRVLALCLAATIAESEGN